MTSFSSVSRLLVAGALLGALAAPAQAQVGQTSAPLLTSPLLKDARKLPGGVLRLSDGSTVQLNERGGLLVSAVVTVPVETPTVTASSGTANVTMTVSGTTAGSAVASARASHLIGLLSGYGDGMAQPLGNVLTQAETGGELARGLQITADPFLIGAQKQGKQLKVSLSRLQTQASAFAKGTNILPPKKATRQPVILRIYSDFQCPYCQQLEAQTWPALSRTLPDDVQVEFHQLPLEPIHPLARPAAEASECAAQQGKFWPFKDSLFADRSWLAGNPNVAFIAQAGQLGLNVDTFKTCLAERGGKAAVDAGVAEANRLGVNGTPTVYVNGFRAPNPYDAAGLLKLVDFARASAAAPASVQTPTLFSAPATPKP